MMLCLVLTTAQADEVARVLIVEPGAYLQTDGDETELHVLDRLDESAILATNDTGILVLQLHNDHLVRIESELQLPVSKLAMLNSPRSKRSVAEQLQALLYPEERERLGAMVTSAEGLGGWHGRLTAAMTPLVTDGSVAGPTPKSALTRDSPRPQLQASGEPTPRPARRSEEAHPLDWEQAVASFQPDGDAHQCVADWSEELAIQLLTDGITITPVVREGQVARLQVDGAYPIPLCLRNSLVGRPASEGAAAVTIRLR